MAQPSIACYFSSRKRSAVEETKINRAKKVLVLDSDKVCNKSSTENILNGDTEGNVKRIVLDKEGSCKLHWKNEKTILPNKVISVPKKSKDAPKTKTSKLKSSKSVPSGSQNLQQLLHNMKNKVENELPPGTIIQEHDIYPKHITPPGSPTKVKNALDKVGDKPDGPSIKEIRRKMSRSARLAELKASLNRFQEGDKKLKQIEEETKKIPESPKLQSFKTIELEVLTSPKKIFSPEKSYLSPKKDSTVRRNLINQFTPTKNAVAVLFESPSKKILEETSKPALTLPYKYRYLAEIFRCIDTVCQILFNRKETITFRKLKPAVEEMLKRNLTENHLGQIKHIYPDAFEFTREKIKVFGAGMKQERYELVVKPIMEDVDHFTSDMLLQRRRKLFNKLLEKTKNYHHEFLSYLDPPLIISKDRITRWHPEFDIERIPELESADLPQPPQEETITGKDVLEKAITLFNCNARMEQALQKLKEKKDKEAQLPTEEEPKTEPQSVLKGIPKALLERVRQKQAAKALISMTRSADYEKELLMYSRLPELARLTRNLFVSEKKGVLPLDVVVEKIGNCYRSHLTKTEIEGHLQALSKEQPNWLIFHNIRNCVYLKIAKNDDISVIISHLEKIIKQKSELQC